MNDQSPTFRTSQLEENTGPGQNQSANPTMGELILHEVGHALGLDHVPASPQEIMNGRGYYQYPDGYYKGLYNLGDLNGLSKVGLKQGCLRQVGRGGRLSGVPVETPPLP
jgi:hypothetical protein